MEEYENFGEIEIEESGFRTLKRVKTGNDTIVLMNDKGGVADGEAMADWFGRVPGIEAVQSLVVAPSSHLKNLMVIKGFPNLRNIQVNGLMIESLEGLEWFRKGRYLMIDTGANRRRSISMISQAPITKLSLQYGGAQDFEALGGSSTITHLELSASPRPELKEWRDVPLEILALSKGKFKELADTAQIPSLSKLTLISCRSLEMLTGDNSGITWLVLQACGRLDLHTIATFSNIESVFVVGNKNEVELSAFAGLRRLKHLSLENCKIKIDVTDIQNLMPVLEMLSVGGLKKDQALELSQLNPGVSISTGHHTFLDGAHIS